ncbi:WD40 repeat domain-containing protein [Cystobacter fuscus]
MDESFSPDGTRIATTSLDGSVHIWDAATGKLLVTLSGHATGPVEQVRFSADGTRVLTTYRKDIPRLWDAASGQLLAKPLGKSSMLQRARLSDDGSRLFTPDANGTIRIWTPKPWEPLETQLASWSAGRDLTCEERVLYLHEKRKCRPTGGSPG